MAARERAGSGDTEGSSVRQRSISGSFAVAGAAGAANQEDQVEARGALSKGIEAVMSAMSNEVCFTDENEVAFTLLRRGCRHCSVHSTESLEALREVPLQQEAVAATVVQFLARIAASRRGASRRVQELGAILAKASVPWSELLNQQPALAALLRGEHSKDTEPAIGPRPQHEAHIFLRERRSRRFLSLTEDEETNVTCCIMTEAASSMFICQWRGGVASDELEGAKTNESDVHPELGFLHEGVPAFNCFLGCRRYWVGWELCCSSRLFGKQEGFRWGADSSLQHFSTGLWLWVDPLMHQNVALHAEERSAWDVLLAT